MLVYFIDVNDNIRGKGVYKYMLWFMYLLTVPKTEPTVQKIASKHLLPVNWCMSAIFLLLG